LGLAAVIGVLVCAGFVCYKLHIGVIKNGHDQSVGP